mmetsp:Transcript_7158/g.11773  ORF Transcript_7158/g.11773 Transcript_7158/m.11773 type:complete len:241 (+) Transcript_7158:488-1210(+)
MCQQGLFDFGRVDVVTTTDDQVFSPTGNPEISVFVQAPEIAGAQMRAVVEQINVFIRFGVGVARVNARVGHTDFAHFVRGAFHRTVRRVFNDAHISVGERQANGTNFLGTGWRVARHKTGRLCQTVAFDNVDTTGAFKAFEQLHRHGRGTGEGGFHGRNIRIHRTLHQRRDCGWNSDDEGDFPAFDQLPEVVKHAITAIPRRCREDHMCAGFDRGLHNNVHRKHVEQRQRAHNIVFFGKE